MTAPPTERALEKARNAEKSCNHALKGPQILMLCEECLAHALDAERAAVWEEAAKMVNELWSATVPLLPASFIGLSASISRRAGKSRPRRRTGGH